MQPPNQSKLGRRMVHEFLWREEHPEAPKERILVSGVSVSFGVLFGLLPDLRPALLLAAFYLTFSLILIKIGRAHV